MPYHSSEAKKQNPQERSALTLKSAQVIFYPNVGTKKKKKNKKNKKKKERKIERREKERKERRKKKKKTVSI